MQNDLVKLCPQCGSEYQMWVERCLDCDVPLVHGREGEGAAIAGPGEEVSHDISTYPQDCVHLRTAPPRWIGRLSGDLDEAGIRHWVAAEWQKDPSLFVLPADLETARMIDQERYALEMPEVGAAREDARPRRPVLRREISSYDSETKICPSCGGEYQLRVETCVDCGVPLVRPWDLDSIRQNETPRVAAPTSAPSDVPGVCPACGERLREGDLECAGCSLMLAQPDACPNCGVELEPFVSSCRRCGQELSGTMES